MSLPAVAFRAESFGKSLSNFAVTQARSRGPGLDHNKVTPDQIDWLVPHQANVRILESVADHFKFPKERVVIELQETGNTSAASIPVAFDIARNKGNIKRGQLILLAAFGAGLTSGSVLLRY